MINLGSLCAWPDSRYFIYYLQNSQTSEQCCFQLFPSHQIKHTMYKTTRRVYRHATGSVRLLNANVFLLSECNQNHSFVQQNHLVHYTRTSNVVFCVAAGSSHAHRHSLFEDKTSFEVSTVMLRVWAALSVSSVTRL